MRVNELSSFIVAEIAAPFPEIFTYSTVTPIYTITPSLIDITGADNSSCVSVVSAGLIAIPDIVKVPDSTEKMLLSGMNPAVELRRNVMSENEIVSDPEREKAGL